MPKSEAGCRGSLTRTATGDLWNALHPDPKHAWRARTETPRAPRRARAQRDHCPVANLTEPAAGAGVRARRSRSRPSPRTGMRSACEEPRARRPRPPSSRARTGRSVLEPRALCALPGLGVAAEEG